MGQCDRCGLEKAQYIMKQKMTALDYPSPTGGIRKKICSHCYNLLNPQHLESVTVEPTEETQEKLRNACPIMDEKFIQCGVVWHFRKIRRGL